MADPLLLPAIPGLPANFIKPYIAEDDSVHAVTHFRELHEKNVKAFEERLHAKERHLQWEDLEDPSRTAAHDELHDLLHRYCRYR
jgi:hypothetical protein